MNSLLIVTQARFAWLFHALEGGNEDLGDMADIFPEQPIEKLAAMLVAVRSWLASLPLARRPLVKVCITVSSNA